MSNPIPFLFASRPRGTLTLRFARRTRVSTNHRIVKEAAASPGGAGPGAWPGGEAVFTAPPRAQEAKAREHNDVRPAYLDAGRATRVSIDRGPPRRRGGGGKSGRFGPRPSVEETP